MHDAATLSPDQRHRIGRTVGPVLIFIAVTAFLLGPRGAPGELILLAGVPIATLAMAGNVADIWRPTLLLGACVAFLFYIAINASWSVDRGEAYGKVLFFAVTVALVHLALAGLAKLDSRALQEVQRAILIAVFAGALFLGIEILTDQALKRLFFSLVPVTRPDPKHIQVWDGWVTRVNPYMLNRNMAALCLVQWPAFLIMRTLLGDRRARLVGAALLAIAIIAIFGSEHETSMIALAFAAATFAGMSRAAPLIRRLVLTGWVLATLLVVPIAMLAYAQQLHFAKWIPETGRNRIILWAYTAKVIGNAPVLGIGVASTKDLDEENAPNAEKPPGYTYALRTGRHSHNVFMQTWYELGAVGAILLFLIGFSGIRLLSSVPARDQPLAFASFVSAVMIGAFSWGMWQTWFIAAYGIWAVLLAAALEGARRQVLEPACSSATSGG